MGRCYVRGDGPPRRRRAPGPPHGRGARRGTGAPGGEAGRLLGESGTPRHLSHLPQRGDRRRAGRGGGAKPLPPTESEQDCIRQICLHDVTLPASGKLARRAKKKEATYQGKPTSLPGGGAREG